MLFGQKKGQCAMELCFVVFSSFLSQVKSDGDFLKARKSSTSIMPDHRMQNYM